MKPDVGLRPVIVEYAAAQDLDARALVEHLLGARDEEPTVEHVRDALAQQDANLLALRHGAAERKAVGNPVVIMG